MFFGLRIDARTCGLSVHAGLSSAATPAVTILYSSRGCTAIVYRAEMSYTQPGMLAFGYRMSCIPFDVSSLLIVSRTAILIMINMQLASRLHDSPGTEDYKQRRKPKEASHRPQRRSDRQNTLAKAVRENVKKLLQPNDEPLQSVTPGELQDFDKEIHGGPSIEDFRLDFRSKGSWGAWNRAAADVFVEYFMNLQGHEQFDGGSVKKAFQTHLKQLKKNYNRRPNAKDIKARRAGRVRRTFERRMNAIDVFQTQYPNDKDMKRIARASSYITMEAMSGEESCEEGVLTTKLPWRSRELEDFLHRCSDLHLSVKYNQNKSYKNGAFPARRFPSDKIDLREQAPAGLPLNFYNDAWLNNANHPNRRASMKPKPAINLALPEFVLRLGKRFEHVNTRADVPLPPDAV
ncbi:hypothetical protein K435DRAFT_853551 [Dendrothele bispora CBS 962.96]|uniref:Uncharacterized protein n=1 Tax=Dendrothele bispora (strain CBS 962.96) TaxID=1314807 RepID=A0A4S8MGQ3_DENBC|nr:hypothetical protein K435DRAFT_853551 [Dendrothele bispora CBS 962.96]